MDELVVPDLSLRPVEVLHRHAGGFGEVLIVESNEGDRWALKRLKPQLRTRASDLKAEVERLASLPYHPHVIRIQHVTRIDGDLHIVLPFYPGTLRMLVNAAAPLPSERVERLGHELASALAHVHENGVLHLDLKPSNVLFDEEEHPVLADFGLAALFEAPTLEDGGEALVTAAAGTVPYMSPEHFTKGKVGSPSDVFALGIILFECLTGRHPFLAETQRATAENIVQAQPKFSWSERWHLPKHLRELVSSMLSKSPDDRPRATSLASALGGRPSDGPADPNRKGVVELVNRASSLVGVGDFQQAETLLSEALERAPWSVHARATLAQLYHAQRRPKEAAAVIEEVLELIDRGVATTSGLQMLLVNLSNYYLTIDPNTARKYASRAADMDPSDWQAFGNLAEACRLLGSDFLEDGIAAARRGLELNPDDLKLRNTYGWLLLERGDFERDFDELTRIITETMNEAGDWHVNTRLLYIHVLIATGQLEEARRWLEPMRGTSEIASIVEQTAQEIEQRARELRADESGST